MSIKTIALLYPGEMGAAIGACLVRRGLRVVWASSGRSATTRSRALAAGLEDLGSVERALKVADLALSVCPPHGALTLAREVAGHGFEGVFVDANAIAPETARSVGRTVEKPGGRPAASKVAAISSISPTQRQPFASAERLARS
ncbi:MAG TPA: hypothetical protein VE008_09340 [Burkholderiales bacterium]|nr:hypothetical protein [Burkholderiales bacterium]